MPDRLTSGAVQLQTLARGAGVSVADAATSLSVSWAPPLDDNGYEVTGYEVEWWRGEGVDEVGYDKANPARELVKIDPKYFRPTEVELLIGDPTKAKEKLGWVPKISMEELCKEMVASDIKLVEKGDLTS